jgi:hypothetical protein
MINLNNNAAVLIKAPKFRGGRALPGERCGRKPESTRLGQGGPKLLHAALILWEKRQGIFQLSQWDAVKMRRAARVMRLKKQKRKRSANIL